jgi:hypothetical protein
MAKSNEKNAYAKIVAHAWKDARFKEKLLKNPKEALKEMGMDVPANFDVRVIEEKSNTMTFILPKVPEKLQKLSDQELEKLAGGTRGTPVEGSVTGRGETGRSCQPWREWWD